MSDLGRITPCYTMTFERKSKHTADRLWRAITDPEEVGRWMTFPARIDLRVGGDYYVDFGRTNEGAIDGVIVRVEPGRRLAYVWGLSVLEWTIEPDASGCRYTFVHHGQPPGLVDHEEGIAAGWHVWLEDLDAHLEGETPGPDEDHARWNAARPAYRERIGSVTRAR